MMKSSLVCPLAKLLKIQHFSISEKIPNKSKKKKTATVEHPLFLECYKNNYLVYSCSLQHFILK